MTSPLKAIRLKCTDCCCGQIVEVRSCPCEDCPLRRFRFGTNPSRRGIGNPASLANARLSRKTPSHGAIPDAQGAGAANEPLAEVQP
jgi:hypothetical protein